MNTITAWPSQAENWLDQKGKPAWIIAMVLGFIVFWPVGLALLFYMIWSNRMFTKKFKQPKIFSRNAYTSSGNTAFDAYKADTLRRLEEEQGNFEAFLERLREAKDQSEFDDFLDDRAKKSVDIKEPIEA